MRHGSITIIHAFAVAMCLVLQLSVSMPVPSTSQPRVINDIPVVYVKSRVPPPLPTGWIEQNRDALLQEMKDRTFLFIVGQEHSGLTSFGS